MNKRRLFEDIKKSDIEDIVKKKLETFHKSQDLKKTIKTIVGEVFEEWFKDAYNRRSTTIRQITR